MTISFEWLKNFNPMTAIEYKGTYDDPEAFGFIKFLMGAGAVMLILLTFPIYINGNSEAISTFQLILFWEMVFIYILNRRIEKQKGK